MPCADDSKYIDEYKRKERAETKKYLTERLDDGLNQLDTQKARADKLARMLCEFITSIDINSDSIVETFMSNELREWWHEHQKFDVKRIQKEELMEQVKQYQKILYELSQKIYDLDK